MVLYNWFGSKYDGQSYYIKNVNIDSYCYNVGLFGTTAGAEIANIVLYSDNGAVIQRNTDPTPSSGTRTVRQYSASYALGGLVGIAYDYNSSMGNGSITKKLTVQASAFSASAKEKIEAAGGKAEVI